MQHLRQKIFSYLIFNADYLFYVLRAHVLRASQKKHRFHKSPLITNLKIYTNKNMKTTTILTLLFAIMFSPIFAQKPTKAASAATIQKQIDKAKEGSTITIKKNTYNGLLKISNKKNITLDFAGSTLITNEDVTMFIIENSSDIKIKGLTIYHQIEGELGCFSNCFDVNHCKNVSFENCDINGSGYIGVCINQSDVTIEKTILHKCEYGVFIWNDNEETTTKFKDCKVVIKDTKFENNRANNVVVYSWYVAKATIDVSLNGKSFVLNKDNADNYKDNSGSADCVLD